MKICFDTLPVVSQYSCGRGIGIYAEKLMEYVASQNSEKVILATYNEMKSVNEFDNCEEKPIYFGPKVNDDEWLFLVEELKEYGVRILDAYINQNGIDIFHMPNFTEITFDVSELKKINKTNTIFSATVHDLIPLVYENVYLSTKEKKANYLRKMENLNHLDLILVDSQSTKEDLLRFTSIDEKRIFVTYLGSSLLARPENDIKYLTLEKYKIKKSYLMYTGGDDYRKNIENLIRAFELSGSVVHKNFQLIIVCKLHNKNHYLSIIAKLNLQDKVILTDYVTDDELITLYNNASAFIFPSMYEGFGLPLLEAMQFDLPIATGNASSMPEIVGDAALLFDPINIEEIANSINRILLDEELREQLKKNAKLQKNKSSWEKCAKDTLAAFNTALANKQNILDSLKSKHNTIKAAYLSPLNPDKSGISDYSEDLLPYLSKYFEIDLFTSTEDISNSFLSDNYNVYKYDEFSAKHTQYEVVFYQMGNSEFHMDILKYLRLFPGIVVLHDYNQRVFFDYLGNWKKNSPMNKGFILDNFFLQYGKKGFSYYKQYNDTLCYERKVEFNRLVSANAEGIIVHSDFAKSRLQKFSRMLPVEKVFQATPDYPIKLDKSKRIELMEKYGIKTDDIVISTFGFAIPEKRDHILLESFGEFYSRYPKKENLKLMFVGQLSDVVSEKLEEITKKYQISNNVIVTGWTEMEEFTNLMYITDIAFNLRFPTNGETSACLSRLLAIGKPVVITDVDAFSEYSDQICMKIRYNEFEKEDILSALELLVNNKSERTRLASNARSFMREFCTLEQSAENYYKFAKYILELRNNKQRDRGYTKQELEQTVKVYTQYKNTDCLDGFNDEIVSISEILSRI